MRKLCWLMALMMALTLCFVAVAPAEEEWDGYYYELGDKIGDFTVTTCDGQEVSLYGLLAEKEMVLINIWATWCGPCRSEFPYMEEAYEAYADKVGIIALSCEPTDTDDVLRDFAAEFGLTFYVAQDTPDLSTRFYVTGIPTSIVVDRFGTICFVEAGSQPGADAFARLFDVFLGDDYTESAVLEGIPKEAPNVKGSSPEDLAEALNAAGGSLVFANGTDAYDWPMVAGEAEGRAVAVSTNSNKDDSRSIVTTAVQSQAGDVLCVGFKVSSESGFDVMKILVNGETVKAFGGEKDWMTYAYPFAEAGDYDIAILYAKDETYSGGADTLWLDTVALLSGEEAQAALAANPAYPVSDEVYAIVTNDTARRIVIDDPTGYVEYRYGDLFYLVGDDEACFELGLPARYDPEQAVVSFNYDGSAYTLIDLLQDGKYVVSCGVDSAEITGYCDSTLYFYPSIEDYADTIILTYLKNEENVNMLVEDMTMDADGRVLGSWKYEDGTLPSTDALPEIDDDGWDDLYESAFVVKYVDQDGNPVAGVMLQVCDEYTCMVYNSNADGLCTFTLEPKEWELHTLLVPAGYTGDTETRTCSTGGEFEFVLNKE